MKTTTTWQGKQEFESTQDDNKIRLDGNRLTGFSPKALLLAGLAGCTGIDVVDILEKMRVTITSLTIDAEAEQTEEHPRVFKDIYLHYRVGTNRENEEKVTKAINLSLEKYCGVSAMLKKNSGIHYTLVIG